MNFFNDIFNDKIKKNAVIKTFPNLVQYQQMLLYKYLINIINFIAIKFNFDSNNKEAYIHQFTQNNYRDAIGLLLMLLPYINDDTGEKKMKLRDLSELYIKKVGNFDINETTPVYEYTNIQYGRCKRLHKYQNIIAEEIQFDEQHLNDNYMLLKETITTISNKLYVNWINVRPFSLDYKKTQLFDLTNRYIQSNKLQIDDIELSETNKKFMGSIETGEIYNILCNYVYNDILDIKWMIYDLYENDKNYKFSYLLNSVIDIGDCVKPIKWNLLSVEKQKIFSESWAKLTRAFIHDKKLNISYKNIETIVTSIISYGKNYFMKNIKNYDEKLFADIINVDIDDEDDKTKINTTILKTKLVANIKKLLTLTNIPPEIIYGYISECFFKLSKTWYWSYYLEFNKQGGHYILNPIKNSFISSYNKNLEENNNVTIKCIYNYAKSLCHYEDKTTKKFGIYPLNWKSNDKDKKIKIVDKLNNVTKDWFNIKGILLRRDIKGVNISKTQNNIYIYLRQNLSHIIFTVLLNSGLLSEFIPDKNLSDYELLPKSTNDRNNKIKELVHSNVIEGPNKENFKNSVYFIDNLIYDNHKGYLDTLKKDGDWITTYAMDWISQINLFHHYLNNRVIYITGGTGQGKSTQVPKLLLYTLKMCDYKINALIGCTAPRINALIKNAEYISFQMGIPISKKNETIPGTKKFSTDNYNIQFKHRNGQHEKNQFGLKLKILTDGVLDKQLNSNQLLKHSIKIHDELEYTTQNVYDIIIVDEAHEHNTYMDLILTKMRYATYYNNDVKLIIMSATMDEDEPTYRRYYRMINDNRMYPLSEYIKEKKLDRINVDRRIHISPPGVGTQYTIEEKYPPYNFPSKTNLAENIVLKILDDTTDGDILLFQPGAKEIIESVRYLNNNIPINKSVIALPYYSDLPDKVKTFIEEIDKKKTSMPFTKENLMASPSDLNLESGEKRSYSRVIIVATEIAEASITISSLRFVVDTGTQKINNFNPNVRTETLEKRSISESSRIQRKGRLGRVAPGTAYFTYEKGAMSRNKRPYKIAISNIGDNLYDIMCDKYHDNSDKPLFDKNNDPNKQNSQLVQIYGAKGIDKIVNTQYFINEKFYDYFGNEKFYDYDYNWDESLPHYYSDGYTITTLYDYYGTFYIVHPDELCLERNILGTIININNENCGKFENGKFKSKKIDIFMSVMWENLFIMVNGDKIYKTEFGKKVIELKQHVPPSLESSNIVLSYLYSRKYNCQDAMVKLLTMSTANTTINKLAYKSLSEPKKVYLQEMLQLYGNKSGDTESIIKIFDVVINWYNNIYIKLGFKNETTVIEDIKQKWMNQKKLFFEGLQSEDFSNINSEYLDLLIKLHSKNKLSYTDINDDEIKGLRSYKVLREHNIEMINKSKYITEFQNLCASKYLQYDELIKLYNKYNEINFKLREIEDKLVIIDILTPTLVSEHNKYDTETLVKYCLVQANPNNLLKRVASSDKEHFYVNLLEPSIYNIHKIGKISPFKDDVNTFIKNDYISDVLLYLSKKSDIETEEEVVLFIENIKCEDIPKLLPLIIDQKKLEYDKGKKSNYYYKTYMEKYVNSLMTNTNPHKSKIINNYVDALKDVQFKLFNNYDRNDIKKLGSISGEDTHVKDIIGVDYIKGDDNYLLKGGAANNYKFKIVDMNYINMGANYKFAKYLLDLED